MIIVGGTYSESVVVPSYGPAQGGSGLRGALAIGKRCAELVTALSENEAIEEATLAARTRAAQRDRPVSFEYLTPVSSPRIIGLGSAVAEPITVDGDDVLLVGMVERAKRSIRAKRLVIDPQSPRGQSATLDDDSVADETIFSANAREAANVLEASSGPLSDAATIRERYGYSAVIVRAGAQGGFLADEKGVHEFSAHPTLNVWSLGSGDTFSAAFAAAWAAGHQPREAVEIASSATAWWCETRMAPVPDAILDGSATIETLRGLATPELVTPRYSPRVYLGGPFFTVAERWLVDLVYTTLTGLGAKVFSPIHHVGPGGDSVAAQDIAGLEQCDAMLALSDHYDVGTIFEAGWATARGIPVVAYRSHERAEGDKMLVGLGAEVHSDLTTALYRTVWLAQGAAASPGRHNSVGSDES